jgi:hypothetical protein
MLSTHALITILAALATTVHGHAAMVAVNGANGVIGAGLGINPATPRDGSTKNPFEQDTSIINDKEIAKGKAAPCGRTPGGGVNDIAAGVAGQYLKLPLHAVLTFFSQLSSCRFRWPTLNERQWTSQHDPPSSQRRWCRVSSFSLFPGSFSFCSYSPYACEVNTDATGATFVPMTVVTNVPGTNSRSRAKATDFPLVAQAAPGVTCTGGPDGNACLVRCRNAARAGPFGGCAVGKYPSVLWREMFRINR